MTNKTQTLLINFHSIRENDDFPYWADISVNFTQNSNGDWISDDSGTVTLVISPDNPKEDEYCIPSTSFTDEEMNEILESEDPEKEVKALKEYATQIFNNLENPESDEDYIEEMETWGNDFANEGLCFFNIEYNDKTYSFDAQYDVGFGEWKITNHEYDIELTGGNGNSFDSEDDLSNFFEDDIISELEEKVTDEDEEDEEDEDEDEDEY